jgi:molybdopterin-binding protein
MRYNLFKIQTGDDILKLSARNQLKGKVVSIKEGAVNAIVVIDIGGGNKISATISMDAVKELGLQVGSDAYAVIKATSVMVGIPD